MNSYNMNSGQWQQWQPSQGNSHQVQANFVAVPPASSDLHMNNFNPPVAYYPVVPVSRTMVRLNVNGVVPHTQNSNFMLPPSLQPRYGTNQNQNIIRPVTPPKTQTRSNYVSAPVPFNMNNNVNNNGLNTKQEGYNYSDSNNNNDLIAEVLNVHAKEFTFTSTSSNSKTTDSLSVRATEFKPQDVFTAGSGPTTSSTRQAVDLSKFNSYQPREPKALQAASQSSSPSPTTGYNRNIFQNAFGSLQSSGSRPIQVKTPPPKMIDAESQTMLEGIQLDSKICSQCQAVLKGEPIVINNSDVVPRLMRSKDISMQHKLKYLAVKAAVLVRQSPCMISTPQQLKSRLLIRLKKMCSQFGTETTDVTEWQDDIACSVAVNLLTEEPELSTLANGGRFLKQLKEEVDGEIEIARDILNPKDDDISDQKQLTIDTSPALSISVETIPNSNTSALTPTQISNLSSALTNPALVNNLPSAFTPNLNALNFPSVKPFLSTNTSVLNSLLSNNTVNNSIPALNTTTTNPASSLYRDNNNTTNPSLLEIQQNYLNLFSGIGLNSLPSQPQISPGLSSSGLELSSDRFVSDLSQTFGELTLGSNPIPRISPSLSSIEDMLSQSNKEQLRHLSGSATNSESEKTVKKKHSVTSQSSKDLALGKKKAAPLDFRSSKVLKSSSEIETNNEKYIGSDCSSGLESRLNALFNSLAGDEDKDKQTSLSLNSGTRFSSQAHSTKRLTPLQRKLLRKTEIVNRKTPSPVVPILEEPSSFPTSILNENQFGGSDKHPHCFSRNSITPSPPGFDLNIVKLPESGTLIAPCGVGDIVAPKPRKVSPVSKTILHLMGKELLCDDISAPAKRHRNERDKRLQLNSPDAELNFAHTTAKLQNDFKSDKNHNLAPNDYTFEFNLKNNGSSTEAESNAKASNRHNSGLFKIEKNYEFNSFPAVDSRNSVSDSSFSELSGRKSAEIGNWSDYSTDNDRSTPDSMKAPFKFGESNVCQDRYSTKSRKSKSKPKLTMFSSMSKDSCSSRGNPTSPPLEICVNRSWSSLFSSKPEDSNPPKRSKSERGNSAFKQAVRNVVMDAVTFNQEQDPCPKRKGSYGLDNFQQTPASLQNKKDMDKDKKEKEESSGEPVFLTEWKVVTKKSKRGADTADMEKMLQEFRTEVHYKDLCLTIKEKYKNISKKNAQDVLETVFVETDGMVGLQEWEVLEEIDEALLQMCPEKVKPKKRSKVSKSQEKNPGKKSGSESETKSLNSSSCSSRIQSPSDLALHHLNNQ